MDHLKKYANALRGLNDLERKPETGWVKELSLNERMLAVKHFREILPTALLKQHDHKMAQGKRSLVVVMGDGVCGGCYLRLPWGHRTRNAKAEHLDVCDYCGVFLEWPTASLKKAEA